MSDSVMTGAEMLRSMASMTVQRPSPESGTQASRPSRVGVLFERVGGEVEQPGTDDRALLPDAGDLREVEVEGLFGFEDGEAFGVGLHHAVLDAVVDHLDEVAGAGWADVAPALGLAGGERFEDGGEAFDGGLVAADHEGVALLEAPDSAGGAAVDELEAGRA